MTTARLVLKPLTESDAPEMVEVLAAPELYTFIGGEPPTPEALRARYARLAVGHSPDGSQEWVNWIARRAEDGVAVGTVQATVTDGGWHADVAWVVGAAWQGRGYAVEAASALVAWLRERGVAEIGANIHPGHTASARVAERIGLAPTGELDDEGEQLWRAQDVPGRTTVDEDPERTEKTR
ncbi:GNAT family N-acetyltransferase [Catenulispora rubra]|uniref:GNAT family N-acetyltransferase n=1 Tax=Catenulispora rubra TaxID=280293 RepID=UPI001E2B4602|nr:GNAT family N-acetyltransferase [Catenulispora rubra]